MKNELNNFDLLKEIERLKKELAEANIWVKNWEKDYEHAIQTLPELIEIDEAAEQFEVSVETLNDLVKKDLIPHYVWGNKGEKIICFCYKEVEAFFENDVYVPNWQIPIQQAS